MHYSIDYNIFNVANQLFSAYYNIAPELKIFVLQLRKLIRAANFIHTLEEKQKV